MCALFDTLRSVGLLPDRFCVQCLLYVLRRKTLNKVVDLSLLRASVMIYVVDRDVLGSERVSAVDIACYGPRTYHEHYTLSSAHVATEYLHFIHGP